jgi:hypothetical protein
MTSRRLFIIFPLSVAAGVAAFHFMPKPLPELSPQELIAEVRSGYVHEVVVIDNEVVTGVSMKRGAFRVDLRRGDTSLIEQLSAMGVEVRFEKEPLGLI